MSDRNRNLLAKQLWEEELDEEDKVATVELMMEHGWDRAEAIYWACERFRSDFEYALMQDLAS